MPTYLTHQPTWEAIWPLLLLPIIVALLIFFASFKSASRFEIMMVCLGFSSLGLVAGYLTSLSRQPAIGDLIPAVLSLIGALAVYMIGKVKESRIVISTAIFLFSASLLLGANWGAVTRTESDLYLKSKEYLMQRILIEKELQDFKKALGFDEKTPNKKMQPTR